MEKMLNGVHGQGRQAAAPLQALCIPGLHVNAGFITAFAATLQHLVLPKLPCVTASMLPAVVSQLTALQVRLRARPSRCPRGK